ncbi:hypothetical protein [Corynebacterium diphtheriae]|uniref:Secreted protein n=2 Tax=Corynebacterium diphtheriae TaxID=1717 RepID=A0AAX0J1J1_CORDP|nr:hypothetical protein [Corynebacterium diphtheriae]APM35247.1 hypothetical protein BS112_01040 [Corynebacterium diphtheriae]MBG9226705.1 hypothetical protein [Corynebacterium diphtheriae bv. gravis]MBG9253936.1 hypothetical protein [Corynebacterium diphtheriae bv. mitis]MBG9260926.1 hypothetical protein [Corynebacterium diphtheriae bv. mitis]MBG9267676.1 hypothetical protein [Corynebacterium diphtheriae bv. mitis]
MLAHGSMFTSYRTASVYSLFAAEVHYSAHLTIAIRYIYGDRSWYATDSRRNFGGFTRLNPVNSTECCQRLCLG